MIWVALDFVWAIHWEKSGCLMLKSAHESSCCDFILKGEKDWEPEFRNWRTPRCPRFVIHEDVADKDMNATPHNEISGQIKLVCSGRAIWAIIIVWQEYFQPVGPGPGQCGSLSLSAHLSEAVHPHQHNTCLKTPTGFWESLSTWMLIY